MNRSGLEVGDSARSSFLPTVVLGLGLQPAIECWLASSFPPHFRLCLRLPKLEFLVWVLWLVMVFNVPSVQDVLSSRESQDLAYL